MSTPLGALGGADRAPADGQSVILGGLGMLVKRKMALVCARADRAKRMPG